MSLKTDLPPVWLGRVPYYFAEGRAEKCGISIDVDAEGSHHVVRHGRERIQDYGERIYDALRTIAYGGQVVRDVPGGFPGTGTVVSAVMGVNVAASASRSAARAPPSARLHVGCSEHRAG